MYKKYIYFILILAAIPVIMMLKPTGLQAALTQVDVGFGVIVPTSIVLPVGGAISPTNTFIKIRADSAISPTFRVSTVGSTIAELHTGSTLQSINAGGTNIADVNLTVDMYNVYTLDINHNYAAGALGNNSDGIYDNWTLEITHGDTDSHTFHFSVGHTELDATQAGIELRPRDVDPSDGIDFNIEDDGSFTNILVQNGVEHVATAVSIGTGPFTFLSPIENAATVPASSACNDFTVLTFDIATPMQSNDTREIPVSYIPQNTGDVDCYGLTVHGVGGVDSNTLRLIGSSHELEVALLLDVSGSMIQSIGDTKNRWDGAVEAAEELLTLLSNFSYGQAYYGVFTFPDPDTPGPNGKTVTSMRLTTPGDINTSKVDLGFLSPTDRTPMGAGIEEAVNGMSTNFDNFRYIILLSDGAHNYPPPDPEDFYDVFEDENIKVYTIAYGDDSDMWNYDPLQLAEISEESGINLTEVPLPRIAYAPDGYYPERAYELRKEFRNFLADNEGINVPLSLDPKAYIYADGNNTHLVNVSPSDSTVSFIVDWTTWDPNRLGFELITPDNETITPQVAAGSQFIMYASSERFKIYTVTGLYLKDPSKHGVWRMEISGDSIESGGEDYSWSVINKSSLIMYDHFDKSSYFTGDQIKIDVRLVHRGSTLHDPNINIQAIVKWPSNSFNNYIANNFVTETEMRNVPQWLSFSPNIAKKAYVIENFHNLYFDSNYRYSTIQFNDEGINEDDVSGDGFYTATFGNTYKPGVYTFLITATGEDKDGMKFIRQKEVDIFIDAFVSPEFIDVATRYEQLPNNITRATVTLDLQDNFGNAIIHIPRSQPISFAADGGSLQGALVSNLDGTYSQKVIYERDPTLSIMLNGETISTQKLVPFRVLPYSPPINTYINYYSYNIPTFYYGVDYYMNTIMRFQQGYLPYIQYPIFNQTVTYPKTIKHRIPSYSYGVSPYQDIFSYSTMPWTIIPYARFYYPSYLYDPSNLFLLSGYF